MSDDNARARGFCSDLIIFEYSYVKKVPALLRNRPQPRSQGPFSTSRKYRPIVYSEELRHRNCFFCGNKN